MIQSGINTPVDVHDLSELAAHNDYKNVYSSMIAAAPKPESE